VSSIIRRFATDRILESFGLLKESSMMTAPQDEEPGFETDVNELPDDDKGPEDTLEDKPIADKQNSNDLEDAQKEGAEEREEGGLY
jgi:hypothetical protein